MTSSHQSRSSALFLTELILSILLFSVAGAVCVQIFVKAHLLSVHARQLNLAANEAGAAAELIEASDSMDEALKLLCDRYPTARQTDGESTEPDGSTGLLIFYDRDLNPCEEDDATLIFSVMLAEEPPMLEADLSMRQATAADSAQAEVYTLHISHYLQRRNSYAS